MPAVANGNVNHRHAMPSMSGTGFWKSALPTNINCRKMANESKTVAPSLTHRMATCKWCVAMVIHCFHIARDSILVPPLERCDQLLHLKQVAMLIFNQLGKISIANF
jgi:hypothetical protein